MQLLYFASLQLLSIFSPYEYKSFIHVKRKSKPRANAEVKTKLYPGCKFKKTKPNKSEHCVCVVCTSNRHHTIFCVPRKTPEARRRSDIPTTILHINTNKLLFEMKIVFRIDQFLWLVFSHPAVHHH